MTQNNPNTLIIIPCLNEEFHIELLVKTLVKDNENLDTRIIITDGGSTDKTIEIANTLEKEFTNVHLLHNPKKIQSAAINLAVEKYGDDAQYLIRIDAHAGYPNNYCNALLSEAQKTNADSIVVAMETIGLIPLQEAIAYAQNSKMGNGGSPHRNADQGGKYVDHGHHALMKIDAFKKVDGYDEKFSHNEDAELDKRLIDANYKIWLSDQTQCTYYPRDNIPALFKQYMNYGYGRANTILKHKMKPKIRQMAPAAIFPVCILVLLFGALTPIFSLLILAWAAMCLSYGFRLGKQEDKSHVSLWSGIAAMTMHFGWSIGFWHALALYTIQKIKERRNEN